MPTRQDTAKAHGEPPGNEELEGAKKKLGWPLEPLFYIPNDVLEHFREVGEKGKETENEWNTLFESYSKKYPELASEYRRRMEGELPKGWDKDLPFFDADEKGIATRAASGKIINTLAKRLPELIGGSADLTPSNKTWIDESTSFQADTPDGRNLHFGVREHSMAAIVNGMAAHGGVIPFAATFLMFSDYMRPSIRLSALSKHGSIWVFTHDSIGVGEDGPTHQPVEHLAALRAIPRLVVIRPGDANEVTEAWKIAISRRDGPTLLALTRQNVPILDRSKFKSASGAARGAYVLKDYGTSPEIILMASGSEVGLIVQAAEKLFEKDIHSRVVSFPSWELFEMQDKEYKDSVLIPSVSARLAVEAGVSQGWTKWTGENGDSICIDTFGSSAPANVLFEKYGFTVEKVVEHALKLIGK